MNQICHCGAYMQFHADAMCAINHLRFLKCPSCGYTKEAPKARTRMISLNDWITSSGSYPERAKSKELTQEVKDNAELLIAKVNTLLEDLGIKSVKISSGFRPSAANAAAGGAKKSGHLGGFALDIQDDKDQTIGKLILKNHEMLKTHGLWLEDLGSTKGNSNWVHLDRTKRSDRKINTFKP